MASSGWCSPFLPHWALGFWGPGLPTPETFHKGEMQAGGLGSFHSAAPGGSPLSASTDKARGPCPWRWPPHPHPNGMRQTLSLGSLNLAPLTHSGFCLPPETHGGATCSVTPEPERVSGSCSAEEWFLPCRLPEQGGRRGHRLSSRTPQPPARGLVFPPSQDSGLVFLVHTPWLRPPRISHPSLFIHLQLPVR